MGNGAKAASKRERNAKDSKGTAKSQKKSNEAAKTILCTKCKQSFLSTNRIGDLQAHADSKHANMAFQELFPDYVPPQKK
ncbi:hypothetical protein ETB97_001569 [Aspergillus alliaceus]|uniref:At2g23090-like protein n=1 Tax=Petromyces alliaceus TaxID=209559 RepID=A0A5N7C2D8_PETAA|nr:At2g23090-like protein [Aspergillus alliaceus]KAB8231392.1 At2g23090-like protein [Aspergillus alliaceus]KAE8388189.1 At2g23090-like protein [Aspergillus alliaceus]KAF5865991.1 hypothetical protein ETB97_001569 [Aspergillus burnettii]